MYEQKQTGNPRECFKCLFYILNTLLLLTACSEMYICLHLMFIASRFGSVPLELSDTDNPLYAIVIVSCQIAGILCGIAGLFTFLISFVGCCGTLNRKPGWLKTYWIGSGILMLIHVFAGGVTGFMLQKVNTDLEDRLMVAIQRYDGKSTFNTFFIDYNQVVFRCCGIRGRDDFQHSAWFQEGHAGVPMSCCQLVSEEKVKMFGNPVKMLTTSDLYDPTCPIDPSGKTHTTQPCLENIRTDLQFPLWMAMWHSTGNIVNLSVMSFIARRIGAAYSATY